MKSNATRYSHDLTGGKVVCDPAIAHDKQTTNVNLTVYTLGTGHEGSPLHPEGGYEQVAVRMGTHDAALAALNLLAHLCVESAATVRQVARRWVDDPAAAADLYGLLSTIDPSYSGMTVPGHCSVCHREALAEPDGTTWKHVGPKPHADGVGRFVEGSTPTRSVMVDAALQLLTREGYEVTAPRS